MIEALLGLAQDKELEAGMRRAAYKSLKRLVGMAAD